MTSQGWRGRWLPRQNVSVSILFIAIFSGKALVAITITTKFKGCILLKEASFDCDRDQILLGKGDHQVPSCQLSDGSWEVWLAPAGLWESVLLLALNCRNHLNIWGCELTQWEGFGLLSWGWHTHVFSFSRVLPPKKSPRATNLWSKTSSDRDFALISFITCCFQIWWCAALTWWPKPSQPPSFGE